MRTHGSRDGEANKVIERFNKQSSRKSSIYRGPSSEKKRPPVVLSVPMPGMRRAPDTIWPELDHSDAS